MTKLRSRSLATHFRSLFTGGTLTGLGEGQLLDRFVSRRDEAALKSWSPGTVRWSWPSAADGSTILTISRTPSRPPS